MNIGLTLLWVLVVILVLALIVFSAASYTQWQSTRSVSTIQVNTACTVPFNQLPSVADQDCCYIGQTPTASRYAPTLDLVVNPVPVPYLDVCQGFCTNGVLASGGCIGGVGQDEYNQCILISTPINCNGVAMPVAAIGTTYFYPNSATEAACLNHGPCSVPI